MKFSQYFDTDMTNILNNTVRFLKSDFIFLFQICTKFWTSAYKNITVVICANSIKFFVGYSTSSFFLIVKRAKESNKT